MLLIDKTHFFDTLSIDHNAVGASDKLYRYIDVYQQEYLVKLLGAENVNTFINNINDPLFATLKSLLVSPISPIACYVFTKFQRDNLIKATSMGDSKSISENSTLASQSFRIVEAWNIMVGKNNEIVKYMIRNRKDLSEQLSYNCLFNKDLFARQNHFGL